MEMMIKSDYSRASVQAFPHLHQQARLLPALISQY